MGTNTVFYILITFVVAYGSSPAGLNLPRAMMLSAVLISAVAEGKEEAGAKFRDCFAYQEVLRSVPPHRALALFRGRKEDILKVSLKLPEEIEAAAAAGSAAAAPFNSSEQKIAARFGIAAACIQQTTDRHWSLSWRRR